MEEKIPLVDGGLLESGHYRVAAGAILLARLDLPGNGVMRAVRPNGGIVESDIQLY